METYIFEGGVENILGDIVAKLFWGRGGKNVRLLPWRGEWQNIF